MFLQAKYILQARYVFTGNVLHFFFFPFINFSSYIPQPPPSLAMPDTHCVQPAGGPLPRSIDGWTSLRPAAVQYFGNRPTKGYIMASDVHTCFLTYICFA